MSDRWMRDVVTRLGDEDRKRLLAILEDANCSEMPPGPAEGRKPSASLRSRSRAISSRRHLT